MGKKQASLCSTLYSWSFNLVWVVTVASIITYKQAGISGCDRSVGDLLYAVSTSTILFSLYIWGLWCLTYEAALTFWWSRLPLYTQTMHLSIILLSSTILCQRRYICNLLCSPIDIQQSVCIICLFSKHRWIMTLFHAGGHGSCSLYCLS
jgi:hypothetical protein